MKNLIPTKYLYMSTSREAWQDNQTSLYCQARWQKLYPGIWLSQGCEGLFDKNIWFQILQEKCWLSCQQPAHHSVVCTVDKIWSEWLSRAGHHCQWPAAYSSCLEIMRTIAILAWRIVFILDTLRYQELNLLYIKASQLLCNLISYKAMSRLSLDKHIFNNSTYIYIFSTNIWTKLMKYYISDWQDSKNTNILYANLVFWIYDDNGTMIPFDPSLSLSLRAYVCTVHSRTEQCTLCSVQCAVFGVHRPTGVYSVSVTQCGLVHHRIHRYFMSS